MMDREGEAGNDGNGEKKNAGTLQLGSKTRDFHHPFVPYAIQEEFMETVYRVLEGGEGRVGILESPTGTVGGVSFLLRHVF